MGGKIGFSSEEGIGSRFSFELPRADPATLASSLPHLDPGADLETFVADHTGRVLYVEDNPVNIDVMTHLFHRLPGVELLIAESAEEGLAMLRATPPDLVLMDINLPGMNGIEALHVIKNDPATAAIPVIAVSAAAMPNEIKAGKDAGFQAYLTKPFNVADLLARIREVLGKVKHSS